MVDRETTAGRALPDLRLAGQVRTAPVRAVARFAQRNPLGAMGGLTVLALLAMVMLALVLGIVAPVVGAVRPQALSMKEMEYIVAARAIGASAERIIVRHIMPNCLAIYLILATYYVGFAIILEASLFFLGLGGDH